MKKTNFIVGLLMGFVILSGGWSPPLLSESLSNVKVEKAALLPPKISVKPKIDGILDEEIWQILPLKRDFISYKPRFGDTLPFETLIWMAYDNQNLYFAFVCCDPEPQKIKADFTRRDKMTDGDDADDWVGISLDSQGTGKTAFDFYVNPINTKGDDFYSIDKGEDFKQDFAWESGAKKTGKGYQVEICIPLKSIRFKSGKQVKMGILFWRRTARLGMHACWPLSRNMKEISNYYRTVIYKDLGN